MMIDFSQLYFYRFLQYLNSRMLLWIRLDVTFLSYSWSRNFKQINHTHTHTYIYIYTQTKIDAVELREPIWNIQKRLLFVALNNLIFIDIYMHLVAYLHLLMPKSQPADKNSNSNSSYFWNSVGYRLIR